MKRVRDLVPNHYSAPLHRKRMNTDMKLIAYRTSDLVFHLVDLFSDDIISPEMCFLCAISIH